MAFFSILLPFLFASFAFCHFLPHLPPFLQKASAEDRRRYDKIVTSPNDTKAVINTNLQSWASSAGVANEYNNFTTARQQRAQQFQNAVTGNLTDQALQLFTNLWSIRQNDQITRLAECQQIRAALNATGWDRVLERLVPIPPPTVEGPPSPGCFPRPPHSTPFGGRRGPMPAGEGQRREGPTAQGARLSNSTDDEK
uniref:DUF148 domain-containing protein n=1 Tax=Globodera pallida TaxID=36090 RepID=A0A183CAR6_GLOPA